MNRMEALTLCVLLFSVPLQFYLTRRDPAEVGKKPVDELSEIIFKIERILNFKQWVKWTELMEKYFYSLVFYAPKIDLPEDKQLQEDEAKDKAEQQEEHETDVLDTDQRHASDESESNAVGGVEIEEFDLLVKQIMKNPKKFRKLLFQDMADEDESSLDLEEVMKTLKGADLKKGNGYAILAFDLQDLKKEKTDLPQDANEDFVTSDDVINSEDKETAARNLPDGSHQKRVSVTPQEINSEQPAIQAEQVIEAQTHLDNSGEDKQDAFGPPQNQFEMPEEEKKEIKRIFKKIKLANKLGNVELQETYDTEAENEDGQTNSELSIETNSAEEKELLSRSNRIEEILKSYDLGLDDDSIKEIKNFVLQEQDTVDAAKSSKTEATIEDDYKHPVSAPSEYYAQSDQPRSPRPWHVKFKVGQVVHHALHKYRGVIIGWDEIAKAPEKWLKLMHPRDKRQKWGEAPNYAILVDTRDRFSPQMSYAVEENLEVSSGRVIHPELYKFVEHYDDRRKRYVSRPWLHRVYPHDA